MSRWSSSLNAAAAERSSIIGCFLVELDFVSGFVRANDSAMNLSFGGNEFTGIGTFGSFDGVKEDIDGVAYGVRFELSGVDSGLIATIMTERYQGRPARLYVGMFDANHALVDTPEIVWSGQIDTMTIEHSGRESKIVLQCEHRLRNAPPVSRWCDAEQQTRSPGDRFFEFTPLVAGYTSSWGGKATVWSIKPGGGYNTPG
jgi:hypothetical protein